MNKIKIVLPAVSNDPISEYMRYLTEAICKATGEENGYGLGGRFGYGENFENEVFMMHRYCWCEQTNCPWCVGCSCGDDWETNECGYCLGEVKAAPNFLHKPTGATVHWYKYIGRGMEVSEADWPAIICECLASLSGEAKA